ncbi:MAG: anti-sigma factor [Caldilineaceae bacterium]
MTEQENSSSEPLSYAQVQELLAGFAMGALDVHEMQAVERYLQDHEQLLRQRYDIELASQALAYGAAPRPLAASVKQRLMDRVRSDVHEPRRMPFAPAPAQAPLPFQAQPRRRSGSLPLFPDQQRSANSERIWVQGLLGFAALAATAILLFSNWQLQRTNEQLNQQVTTINNQLADAQTTLQQREDTLTALQTEVQSNGDQVASLQEQVQTTQRDLAEVQNSNDTLKQRVTDLGNENRDLLLANRLLTLASTGSTTAGGTFLVTNGKAYLTVRGLSPLPADKTYQLWYIPEGQSPQPADLFKVDQDTTTLVLSIPQTVTDFANIGVSIEPAQGSQAPTDVVLIGT